MAQINNIIFLISFITLLCTCDSISFSIAPTRTATLTPNAPNQNQALVVIANANEVSTSFGPPPARWIVTVKQNNTWHLGVSASSGGNWGFDPIFISAITFQLDSPTLTSSTFDDIMVAFTAPNTNGDDYIAVRLFMDNSETNRISPFCDTSADPSDNTKMKGSLNSLPDTDRICDVMNSCSGTNYDQYEPLNIAIPVTQENNAFPIKFTVINYPTPGFMYIYYESADFSTDFEQKCGYSAFPTDQGLQMLLAVNSIGDIFEITQFKVDYYVFTEAPTSEPTTAVPTTSQPTTVDPTTATPTTGSPTTAAPTNPPLSALVTIWHQEMAILNTANWTTESFGTSITYRDGSDGGCPLNSISTCWALCAANFGFGSFAAYRSVSTTGFQNIAITFSVDPWAMTLPATYCEVSYSLDEQNWTPIGAQYDSAHHIIDETIFLDAITWDTNNVAVRIETVGSSNSNCCYMSDWYLSGIVITESPTSHPSTSPTLNPITAVPTTKYPTISPTTTAPTTAIPTTSNPSSAPTYDGQTSTPTTSQPTTAVPTTSNPTTSEPSTFDPTKAVPTLQPTTAEPSSQPITSEPTTLEPSMIPTRGNAGQVDDTDDGDDNSDQDNENGDQDTARSDSNGLMDTGNTLIYVIIGVGVCCICLLLIGVLMIRNKKRKKNKKIVDNITSTFHEKRLQSVASQSNLEMPDLTNNKIAIVSSPSTEYEGNININGTEFNTNLNSLQTANNLLMEDVVDEMDIMNGIENDDHDHQNEVNYVTKGGPDMDEMDDMDDDDLLPGPQTVGGMNIDLLVNNDDDDEDEYVPPPPQPPTNYIEGDESDEDVIVNYTMTPGGGGLSSGLIDVDVDDEYVPPPPLPPIQMNGDGVDGDCDDDVVMDIIAETAGRY